MTVRFRPHKHKWLEPGEESILFGVQPEPKKLLDRPKDQSEELIKKIFEKEGKELTLFS